MLAGFRPDSRGVHGDLTQAECALQEAQLSLLPRLRLEGVHAPAWADEVGEGQGVHAVGGADVDDLIAGPDDGREPAQLGLGPIQASDEAHEPMGEARPDRYRFQEERNRIGFCRHWCFLVRPGEVPDFTIVVARSAYPGPMDGSVDLRRSRGLASRLEVLEEAGSTNTELAERAAAGPIADFFVLLTTNQTAGRGRLGRTWTAPPGASLAVSIFLAGEASGWTPLLAGVAMQRAVASIVPGTVALKWPNDVQVEGLKVAGLLAELVPGGVVLGAGLNLTMTADQLPTSASTSLTLQGADPVDLLDRALAGYLAGLRELRGMDAATLRIAVTAACSTLGRAVRVDLPGGEQLRGTAVRLDEDGRLVVRTEAGERAVAAGDVEHVRFPDADVG